MTYAAPPVPTQRSFVLIGPDAVRRGLAGRSSAVLNPRAFDRRDGAAADDRRACRPAYAEHLERPFYPPLRLFVTSGQSVAMIVEGDEAIDVVRTINGATDGRKAAPALSAVTSHCPIGKTWCTAPTLSSRPSVRSRSGSLISRLTRR